MNLIDIHSHLDHSKFKSDLDKVIERAKKQGVKKIITSGVNSSTNRLILEIQKKYPEIIECSFGIYPLDALASEMNQGESSGFVRDIEKFDLNKELKWIEKNKDKCLAIGEAGLDYKFTKQEKLKQEQKKIFEKVIKLTEKINKPVIVHTRKAELDSVEMLEKSKIKNIILHCFNGRKHLIKRAVENKWYLSIPPIITRLQHFQMLAEIVPLTQILTETDSPYLSPVSGERNESSNVKTTIKEIAKIKNLSEEKTAEQIYKNFKNIFLK